MELAFYIAVSVIAGAVAVLLTAPLFLRPPQAARRILAVVRSTRVDERTITGKERARTAVLSIAAALRSRLGLSDDENLRRRLANAGARGRNPIEIYFASRFLLPCAGILAGSFFKGSSLFARMALGFFGYMLPDIWIARMIRQRNMKMRKALPDAMDLMVICMEAGLGLDQALQKVGQELAFSHPALSDELLRINMEQLAGKPRIDAWRSMAERTRIPEFTSLVNMLIQTDRFGTPVLRAMSRFAEEIRARRRQRAEEEAARSKIKILFPLVLFIFPCIFIVLIGPAILKLMRTFGAN
jgi:tight adherence protein C